MQMVTLAGRKKSWQVCKTDFAFFMLDVFNLYNLITVLLTFGAFDVMAMVYEATHFDLLFSRTWHPPSPDSVFGR